MVNTANNIRRAAFISGILGVLAVGAWLVSQESGDDVVALKPDDAALVTLGSTVYAQQCARCHGDNLEGEANWQIRRDDGLLPAPPHDKTGHTWHHGDNELFKLTKYGAAKLIGDPTYRTEMPTFEDMLTDEEIVAVLSYIKSTWPAKIRERHNQINQRADDR